MCNKIIFVLFFVTLLAFATNAADSRRCLNGNLRWIEFSVPVTQAAEYCFNEKHDVLVSKNCNTSSECRAEIQLKKVLPVSESKLGGSIGTPSAKICKLMGGDFEIIEFQDGSKWYELDRCFFDSDKSFISGGVLLDRQREAINKERQEESLSPLQKAGFQQ